LVRLALAAGQGSEFAATRALVTVDSRGSDECYQRRGETILVYLHVNGVVLDFVGHGRVRSVGLDDGGGFVVELVPYVPFVAPVAGSAELSMPGARRLLELEDGRFDAIMAASREANALAVEEAMADFRPLPTEATYLAIREQVLRAWRHRCAFTGARHSSNLSIVAIRPREQGGPLHVGNYLPMIAELERAWRLGHFSVGEDFRILGDLYRLAPEQQDSMVALFKMLLPDNSTDYPSAELLQWHRLNVFGKT
jgi:hypothetical protein